ncbi:hypothetical protein [Halorubrum coriense]|uniref:hypothetical protein n=1 Tax=Halorubrum coriense TaxID=64713 RepID=UPI001268B3C8|nr:hypothetical protein [Halorubrum coriense]
MLNLANILATGGLGLDIVGAAVIALPDVPRLRLVLESAVIRKGLEKMESTGIQQGEIGYSHLKELLETKYGVDFPSDVWAFRVGQSTASRYGYESVFLFTDPEDESKQVALGKDLGADVDYRVVRKQIRPLLDREQAIIRASGFLLLSLGFLFQIVARFI